MHDDDRIARSGMKWMRLHGQKKFFMWLHFLAPHKPYAPPQPFDKLFRGDGPAYDLNLERITLNKEDLTPDQLEYVVSQYDGEIAYVSELIERVLNQLKKQKLSDNTLIILTADHGEELYQRNYYFSHGCSIYDSVLRVPLILRLPGGKNAGKRVASVVELIDVAPTLFALSNLPVPLSFLGKSLQPLIDGKAVQGRVAYSEIVDKIGSIRTNQFHYIYNPLGYFPVCDPYRFVEDERRNGYLIQKEELYDLRSDPLEKFNIIRKESARASEFRQHMERWQSTASRAYNPAHPSREVEEELKSLGYIQ